MLSKYSVKKPLTVVVAVIIVILLGVVSYTSLGVDLLPEMELPYLIVVTVYAGAEPDTVDNEVTTPLEESFATVSGVKRINSTSNEHYSMIILELEPDKDSAAMKANLKDAIDLTTLPDSDMLVDPMIIELDPSMLPVMSMSVSYDSDDNDAKNAYLKEVISKLNAVDGVANISESGFVSNYVYLNANSQKTSKHLIEVLEEKFGIRFEISEELKEQIRVELRDIVKDAKSNDSLKTEGEIDPQKVLDALLKELVKGTGADSTNKDNIIGEFVNDYVISELGVDGAARTAAIAFIKIALENSYILEDGEENQAIYNSLVDGLIDSTVTNFVEGYMGSMLNVLSEDIFKQLIYAQDFDMPAGSLKEGATSSVVKVGDNIENREDFMTLPVFTVDVAQVLQDYIERIRTILSLVATLSEDGKISLSDDDLKSLADSIAKQTQSNVDYAEWVVDTLTSESAYSVYYISNPAQKQWVDMLKAEYLDAEKTLRNPFYDLTASWSDVVPIEWRTKLLNCVDENDLFLPDGTIISEAVNWDQSYSDYYANRFALSATASIADKPQAGNYRAYADFVTSQVTTLSQEKVLVWHAYLLENASFKSAVDNITNTPKADWQVSILDAVLEDRIYPDDWSFADRTGTYLALQVAKNTLTANRPSDAEAYARLAIYSVAVTQPEADYYISQSAREAWVQTIASNEAFVSFIDTITDSDDYLYMVYDYLAKDAKAYVDAENKEGLSTLLPVGSVVKEANVWDDTDKALFKAAIASNKVNFASVEASQNELKEAMGEELYNDYYNFFRNRSAEDVYQLFKDVLNVIGDFGGEGAVTEDKDTESGKITHKIDVRKIENALEQKSDDMKITLKMYGLCDVTFLDDLSTQVTKLILGIDKDDVNISNSIQLSVDKEPSASSAEVTKELKAVLEDIAKKDSKFSYTVLTDDGLIIDFMLDSVLSSLLIGGLLALIILIFFLKDIKATLVIGSSILISVLTAVTLMYFTGVSLNVISLGGLTLGVGMLVDNSIVVLENTYRLRAKGFTVLQAAVQGAKQMLPAIFASTLTTIVVFLPIVFISGLVKEIFLDFALTIIYSLGASLIVSMTVVPMAYNSFMNPLDLGKHSALGKKIRGNKLYKAFNSGGVLVEGKITLGVKKAYVKLLNWSLRFKLVPIILVIALFASSIYLAFTGGTEYFPDSYMGYISVSVSIDTTKIDKINEGLEPSSDKYYTYSDAEQDVVDTLIQTFSKYKDINAVGVSRSTGMSIGGMNLGSGNINATLTLIDEKDRELTAQQIVNELDKELDKNANGLFTSSVSMYSLSSLISMSGGSMSLYLYGDDYSKMQQESKALAEILSKIDGVISVDDGVDEANKEYKIIIDKNKANLYGLTVAQVYLQVSAALTEPASLHTLKLDGSDNSGIENLNVYLYDSEYNSKYWYAGVDQNGNDLKVYFKNNVSDNDSGSFNTYYIKSGFNQDTYVRSTINGEQKVQLVQKGDLIECSRVGNKISYEYASVVEQEDGTHLINYTPVEVTINEGVKYYSNVRNDIDILTLPITSANMLDENAETEQVPLYKLLSDDCLLRDNNGNIMYRSSLNDQLIPVGIQLVDGYTSIHHQERQKCITLTVNYNEDINSDTIKGLVDVEVAKYNKTKPVGITVSTTGSQGVMDGVFEDLFMVLGVAIILIFLVMVAQFQSWKSPFIVMGTVVLAFTGSFIMLWATGEKLSIMALIGLIILMGVVVNNGIVFVDYANNLIEKGYSRREAMLKTGADRLRPIIMTAITTVLGMMGMALDGSDYGSLLQPLAITSIGGMVYATIMTLFIVPILYELFNRKTGKRAARAAEYRNSTLDFKEDEFDQVENDVDRFIKSVVNTKTEAKEQVSVSSDTENPENAKNSIRKTSALLRAIKGGKIRIYPLIVGYVTEKSKCLSKKRHLAEKKAVTAYLIESPNGIILVNAGVSNEIRSSKKVAKLYKKYYANVELPQGTAINEQLSARGYSSSDIDCVVLTDLSLINAGGLQLVKNAKKVVYVKDSFKKLDKKSNKLLKEYSAELNVEVLDCSMPHDLLGDAKILIDSVKVKKSDVNFLKVIGVEQSVALGVPSDVVVEATKVLNTYLKDTNLKMLEI